MRALVAAVARLCSLAVGCTELGRATHLWPALFLLDKCFEPAAAATGSGATAAAAAAAPPTVATHTHIVLLLNDDSLPFLSWHWSFMLGLK